MSQGLTTLRKRLEELRVAGSRHGRTLRAAALELDMNGAPFPEGMLAELRRYRKNVEELRSQTLHAATESESLEEAAPADSLGDLSAILRRAEEATRKRELARAARQAAVARLDRVLSIHCADDANFAALRPIHDEANRLRAEIERTGESEVSDSARALAEDKHSLCGLLTLVGGAEGIDDDRWSALLDEVTDKYGRSVSAAVARGRLKCGATPTRTETPSATTKPATTKAPERVATSPASAAVATSPDVPARSAPSASVSTPSAAPSASKIADKPMKLVASTSEKTSPKATTAPVAAPISATSGLKPDTKSKEIKATEIKAADLLRIEPKREELSREPANADSVATEPATTAAAATADSAPAVAPLKTSATSAANSPETESRSPENIPADSGPRKQFSSKYAQRGRARSGGAAPAGVAPKAPDKPAAPRIDLDEAAADEKAGPGVGDAVIMKGGGPVGPKTVSASKTVAGSGRVLMRKLNTVPALAQAALDAGGPERHQHIANLIWKLCLEGRLGIASQLARCLEKRADVNVTHLPSTLLHALCLAPHVQFSQGETARQLSDDFSRLRFASGPRNDAEWAVAWQLLLTAAALRPALLAPTCGASGLLHNMRMIEGLSRLYNYTHRIAIFADAGRPLDVNAFKRARSEQAWEIDLDQFLAEVDAWCGQTPVRRLRYTATTHCFLKSHWSISRGNAATETRSRAMWRIWQSTMDRLHAMLDPVRQNRVDDREMVRAEADLLSDPSEIDLLTSGVQFGRQVATNVDANSREQLRLVVSEAVALARRWLRIHDTPPERRAPAVPRRAEELLEERRAVQLRDEVISRQDAVLKELKSVSERYSAAPIVTAIACCCRSIEQIRRLFDPDEPAATDETDPRLLFNSELLRIPSLALNDAWEPEVGSNELENDLLQLLTRGAPDWRQAFDERADEGDHEATERLLLLPVWQSEDELLTLMEVRDQKLEACREALLRDVDATRSRVAEAFSLGLIQDRDRDNFDSEISVVESSGKTAHRFPPWHRRLSEIREILERRRQYEIQKVRERFDLLKLQQEDPYNVRIDAALNDGNLVRANRYIDMAATGQPLSEEDWVR